MIGMEIRNFRTGVVALVGRPNVGKSTLLNWIVGQKVSIVSDKPQTTRRRVLGIATTESYQIIFIDTPGIHEPHTKLGRAMVDQARAAIADVDVVLFVVDGSHHPGEQDKEIARMLRRTSTPQPPPPFPTNTGQHASGESREMEEGGPQPTPVLLCMNKMDQLKAENVQQFVEAYTELAGTGEYMLTTATRGQNVDKLVEMIVGHLPEGEPLYDADDFTDQSSRFLAGELVREKILQATRQEVPHAVAVLVEEWEDEDDLTRIGATIIVEKASQRGIIIGKQGQFLKKIGTAARQEIEQVLGKRVFLELHVKVQEDWRMNPRILQELEYSD